MTVASENLCEQCGAHIGNAQIETVEGRGPGWKCGCGWWNWLLTDKGAPVAERLRHLAEYQRIRQIAYDDGSAADVLLEAAAALDALGTERTVTGDRAFFSLKQIAETARRENWPRGKALDEARKLLRRKRRAHT